jgi:integrase
MVASARSSMTVSTATVSLADGGPESQASPGELLELASRHDFARWEQQLAATGNCAHPVRLHGHVDSRAIANYISLLKDLAVPARDAQIILGHSRLAVTLEIYTHADEHAQREALTRLHDLFDRAGD